MKIEFDPAKSEKNARERGLPFAMVELIDWSTVQAEDDTRFLYPERRIVASGFIGARLHIVCFTPIEGGIRVISFRKANKREVQNYEAKKAADR
jgi:uncharacterized DUF497 family protein